MCRIDAPFGNISLNEKTSSEERFVQALDEYGIHSSLRSVITEHFSESWRSVFRDIEYFEEALKCAQEHDSEIDKIIGFLSASTVADKLNYEFTCKIAGVTKRTYPLLEFVSDIARSLFPKTAYSFSKLVSEKAIKLTFNDTCVSTFYGDDYCLSEAFFDDTSFSVDNNSTRYHLLINYFYSICGSYESQCHSLFSMLSEGALSDSKEYGNDKLSRGFNFIKSWIRSDAKAGRLEISNTLLIDRINYDWYYELTSRVQSFSDEENIEEKTIADANEWLITKYRELEVEFFTNANLTSISDEETDCWAKGLDHHYSRCANDSLEASLSPEDWQVHYDSCLASLCSKLTSSQIEAWVRWSLNEDIESILKKGTRAHFTNSRQFINKKTASIWKKQFLEAFHKLELEKQLRLLEAEYPTRTYDACLEDRAWWNELLRNLIKDDNFPLQLIPQWTAATKYKLESEERKPFIDKSIGIIRGNLSKAIESDSEKELKQLLEELGRLDPPKALRHHLMLMRSSSKPFSDESISRFSSFDTNNSVSWSLPLATLANDWFSNQERPQRDGGLADWNKAKVECYEVFSHRLAEFCLSRLRLRKGEKASNGQYTSEQVIETSSVWRQGYLKAIGELGFDLNGKAHKTIHFTQNFDPDESVREIAKESYRLVRRNSKKTRTIEDLKRGIIAAEWWFLICQRQELNEDVNYEAALRVRRRLLRNP